MRFYRQWLLCFLFEWVLLSAPGSSLRVRGGDFVITEFMAANASGEKDEDGDFSDWIEIQNGDKRDRSIAGWGLSDDPKTPGKWRFPDVVVPRGGFLMVFASGKNRVDPKRNLHTHFKLSRSGGSLVLSRPDGHFANAFHPYPRQLSDVSYGISMTKDVGTWLAADAIGRWRVPTDNPVAPGWTDTTFDDSGWTRGTNGVGYDRVPLGQVDPTEPPMPFEDLTAPGDSILATSPNSPGSEGVANAIDNKPATKYLNFDKLNSGFTVRPLKGSGVVTGLRFTSANDAPDRDPASFVLSGSNDGQSFVEVSRGSIPAFSGRFTPVQVTFENSAVYAHYRLLFPTVRNAAGTVAMQIAEVDFLGKTGPEPRPISEMVRFNVESSLFAGRKTSIHMRLPFVLTDTLGWDELALLVRYDDGFSAWINGVPFTRANAPADLAFNSVAPTNRFRRDAVQLARFDLSSSANLFHIGTNLLAIQGWNDRADSLDFLLEARIESSRHVMGSTGYCAVATPRAFNSGTQLGLVSDPVPNQSHGFYEGPFELAIACATDGAAIRYTTDGSPPTSTKGLSYSVPLRIDRTTVVRMAAFKDGWRSSRVLTQTYIFLNDVIRQDRPNALAAGFPSTWASQPADYGLDPRVVGPTDSFGGRYAKTLSNDLRSLPTLSIAMEMADLFGPQGIYSNPGNHGMEWERAASLELIHPDKRPGFQADAGLRIQGGAFRGFNLTLKKSFRVIFRSPYGEATLRYPLFGADAAVEFNNFVLRANSNDAWPYAGGSAVYVRDAFAMESARAMGIASSHSTFVHLYLNGLYWGLYNPAERPDAAFSASYHGGDKETWDSINQDSVPDGNYDAWNRMLAMLGQDFTKDDVYQRIQGNNPDGSRNPAYENLLDVDNLIDYLILNFYIGNTDWPGRNWWSGRDRNNGDGFKFRPWDSETALGLSGLEVNVTGAQDAVARPYAALRSNASFRLRFADHVYRHFFNGGAFHVMTTAPWNQAQPEQNRPAARFFALSEQISRGIVGETARWGDQLNAKPYTRDEHWLTARNSLLANFFPRRSAIVLQQFRSAGLYPKADPPSMNMRGGSVEPGFRLSLSAPQGAIYYTTNGADPRNRAGARLYSEPVVLSEGTEIKTRVLNGTEWSALNQATFVVGKPSLGLSELHYHPSTPSPLELAAGFSNAEDFEFIELLNNGSANYDLNGVFFGTGIQFEFTGSKITRLAPGAYLLLVKNQAAFEKRYGMGLPIAGEYSGKLNNSGEHLQAFNAKQEVVLDFTYGVLPPWPESADGSGPSLEVVDPGADLNAAANWVAAVQAGGSPGKANPPAILRVEILRADSTSVRIMFQGKMGSSYTLHSTETLPSKNWAVVETGTTLGTDTRVELTLTPPPNGSARFFRLSVP